MLIGCNDSDGRLLLAESWPSFGSDYNDCC